MPPALQGLVTFSAADNPTLTEIPTLQQLTALKNLELYGCGLTSICPEALQLPNLRRLVTFPVTAGTRRCVTHSVSGPHAESPSRAVPGWKATLSKLRA